MAFFAPALRWPDALGIDATAAIESIRPHLPAPIAKQSPELLFSLLVSFSFIVFFTLLTTVLQARHPKSSAAIRESAHRQVATQRSKHGGTSVVLLAGPSATGKTSLFSALALDSVPSVHPSQRASESKIVVRAPDAALESTPHIEKNVLLVDTPGHPRLKDGAIGEYIRKTDQIVFCIDAKEALRGNAGLSAAKEGSLTEAVDQLHELLIQLAKSRRTRKERSTPPPSLLVLLTRADLSPHTSSISLSSVSAEESKRRTFLLARARTAIEIELGRRRAGMGFGSKRTTKVGGMTSVAGGQVQSSIFSTVLRLIGLGKGADQSAGANQAGSYDEDEEDEELVDYVDWEVFERSLNNNASPGKNGAGHSAGTSLEKLDTEVVENGKAEFAFASVGKERGWDEHKIEGLDELRRILLGA